ncbi:MAG: hypothetical protein AAGF20_00205 [Pseudomonadota bacterium]
MVHYFDYVEYELTEKGMIKSNPIFDGQEIGVAALQDLDGALRTHASLGRAIVCALEAEAKAQEEAEEKVVAFRREA